MIEVVMGRPGVGKSTYLTVRALKYMKKKKRPVYSNVYLKGCYEFDVKMDLGHYNIENALIIIDEGGFEMNSRNWKAFGDNLYRFFTMHRHYNLDVIIAVQFWDRLDITIRELIHRITVVVPTIHSYAFICTKRIKVSIDISEEHQIIEKFSWVNPFIGGTKYWYRYRAYKSFDSFYRDTLPEKQFNVYPSRSRPAWYQRLSKRLKVDKIVSKLKKSKRAA